MLIKDENFRNLYRKPILIKDKEFAHEIARSIQIDSIWEDGLSGEELGQKLKSMKIDENINSILAIAYIDHSAGMSFHVLTTAISDNGTADIIKRNDFQAMINCRKGQVNNFEFDYLENIDVNDDFSMDHYKRSVEIANSYFVSEDIEALRFLDMLDDSRHEDFPDDVEVLFFKEGLQAEKMWVRYEKVIEVPIIEGTLLNAPFQDFGVSEGDKVRFFPYAQKDSNEIILICNLDI